MRDRAVAVMAIGAAFVAAVTIGAGLLLGAAPSPAVAIRPSTSPQAAPWPRMPAKWGNSPASSATSLKTKGYRPCAAGAS